MKPVALVTGGGRGIGLGISKALLGEGFDLAICGVRSEADVASLPELRAEGEVLYVQADVSEPAQRHQLTKAVLAEWGRVDILVNNAGVAPAERLDLTEATEASYDRVMGINLKGPHFLTQAVAKAMVGQSPGPHGFRGMIVFVSSISATIPSTSRAEYCISKAGLSMSARLWSVRLADDQIAVFELRPGIIATDMTSAVREKYDAMIAGGLMLQQRWGSPDDVGKAVAMLARGDMPYSTGQILNIDGGLTRTVL